MRSRRPGTAIALLRGFQVFGFGAKAKRRRSRRRKSQASATGSGLTDAPGGLQVGASGVGGGRRRSSAAAGVSARAMDSASGMGAGLLRGVSTASMVAGATKRTTEGGSDWSYDDGDGDGDGDDDDGEDSEDSDAEIDPEIAKLLEKEVRAMHRHCRRTFIRKAFTMTLVSPACRFRWHSIVLVLIVFTGILPVLVTPNQLRRA